MKASIGVKRMGDLDHKPIVSAAKIKYPAAEAGVKAMEFTSFLDTRIRDSNWYPFKVIMVGADSKVSIMLKKLNCSPLGRPYFLHSLIIVVTL